MIELANCLKVLESNTGSFVSTNDVSDASIATYGNVSAAIQMNSLGNFAECFTKSTSAAMEASRKTKFPSNSKISRGAHRGW
jgi:hypothetical protein